MPVYKFVTMGEVRVSFEQEMFLSCTRVCLSRDTVLLTMIMFCT